MTNTAVQRLNELTDASVTSYQQTLSAGLGAMDQSLGNLHGGANLAELIKHSQSALHQIEKINNQAINHLLCSTIQALNLKAFSQSTRMFSEISETLLTTYVSNQMSLIKALTDTTSDFLDACCKVTQVQDLAVAEAGYLSEIQTDFKNWAGVSGQFLDQTRASYNAWSERTIDLYCKAG